MIDLNAIGRVGAQQVPQDTGDESFWWTALDYAGRPFSAIKGAQVGAVDPNLGIGEGFMQGLTGERYFSNQDLLEQIGFDPEGAVAKWGGLALDIIDPTDPLSYLGAGFVKQAKVARKLQAVTSKVKNLDDVASRASAARAGMWSPVKVAGQAVLPRSLGVLAAPAVDKIADKAHSFWLNNRVAKLFGGVEKWAAAHPEMFKALRAGTHTVFESEQAFSKAMLGLAEDISQKTNPDEAMRIMSKVSALLEEPSSLIGRLEGELADIDAGNYKLPVQFIRSNMDITQSKQYADMTAQEMLKRRGQILEQLTRMREGVNLKAPRPDDITLARLKDAGLSRGEAYTGAQMWTMAAQKYARLEGRDATDILADRLGIRVFDPNPIEPKPPRQTVITSTDEALAAWRREVRSSGVRPPKKKYGEGVTLADFGGRLPPGYLKKDARWGWDQWLEQAQEYGLDVGNKDPSDFRRLLTGSSKYKTVYDDAANTDRVIDDLMRSEPGEFFSGDLSSGDLVIDATGQWRRVESTGDGFRLLDSSGAQVGTVGDFERFNAKGVFHRREAMHYHALARWAEDEGKSIGEVLGGGVRPDSLVDFEKAGRSVINLVKGETDFRRAVKGLTMAVRPMLSPDDMTTVEKWLKIKPGQWDLAAQERFADGFLSFLRNAKGEPFLGPKGDSIRAVRKPARVVEVFRRAKLFAAQSIGAGAEQVGWSEISPAMRGLYSSLMVDSDVIRDMATLRNEAHVLGVVTGHLTGDRPAPEFALRRREEVVKKLDDLRELHGTATVDEVNAANMLKPYLDEIQEGWQKLFGQYDENFAFPIQHYLKHMFPRELSRVHAKHFADRVKLAPELRARAEAKVAELTAKGYDDATIERMLARDLGADMEVLATSDSTLSRAEMTGRIDAFRTRKYKQSIRDINKAYEVRSSGLGERYDFMMGAAKDALEAGKITKREFAAIRKNARKALKEYDIPVFFEDNAVVIADAMNRDLRRTTFAHDIHKFMLDKGYSISSDDLGQLSRAEQANYVKLDFHMPFVDPKKNPYRDRWVDKDTYEIVQRQLNAVNEFSGHDGYAGIAKVLHGIRRVYSAWTLGPFPAYHVRNFGSDMVLAHLAGLSAPKDLLRAAEGRSAFVTAGEMAHYSRRLPQAKGAAPNTPGHLERLIQDVQAAFPDRTDFTADSLINWMRMEKLLGSSSIRDIDMNIIVKDDAIADMVQKARDRQSKGEKAQATLRSLASIDPDRNPITRTGFKVGNVVQDFTRSALFVHSLREAMDMGVETLDDALMHATSQVRKYLFDYQDLTSFERDVMKLVAPFYTFTAKNIPLQLNTLATDTGRHAWANRVFQGVWGQPQAEGLEYEDLPKWMSEAVGLPLRKTVDADGQETYSVFTLRGWLPQTELNEIAEMVRGEEFLRGAAARMNPVFKEFWEQALNYDAYTGRAIADGQTVEMFGLKLPEAIEDPWGPRIRHLLRNVRLIDTIDKLDPGGMFTRLWEASGHTTEPGTGRPHRHAPPGAERAWDFFTGMKVYQATPEREMQRRALEAQRDAAKAKGQARIALRMGQQTEYLSRMQQAQEEVQNARLSLSRLNEIRRLKAMDTARKATP